LILVRTDCNGSSLIIFVLYKESRFYKIPSGGYINYIGQDNLATIISLKNNGILHFFLINLYKKADSNIKLGRYMMLTIEQIQEILPHRYPFLLVDKILELEQGKRAVGIKNVTINEPYFQGHFPGKPIMPGVLIVEALAQVGACAILSLEQNKEKLVLFAGIDDMRFRKPVIPGDILRLEVELTRIKGSVGKANAKATVDDELAAEGEIIFAITDAEKRT